MPPISEIKEMRDLAFLQTRVLSCYATAKQHDFTPVRLSIAHALASSNVLKEESKYQIIFPDMHIRIVFR